METKLVKGGIYGFIVGLMLGILWCPDQITTHGMGGATTTILLPIREYVFKVLRIACLCSLGTVVSVYGREWYARSQQGGQGGNRTAPSFWSGFMKSFLFVLGVLLIAALIAALIR